MWQVYHDTKLDTLCDGRVELLTIMDVKTWFIVAGGIHFHMIYNHKCGVIHTCMSFTTHTSNNNIFILLTPTW